MPVENLGPSVLKFATITFAVGVFLLGQKPVQAQSESGALVIRSCPETTAFTGQTDGLAYEVCADIVFTPSGIVNASFHGTLIDPSKAPSKTIVARDFPCEYNGIKSNESQVVITPDGSVNGYCKLHNN